MNPNSQAAVTATAWIMVIVGTAMYFIPVYVALARKVNRGSVFVVNLLLGWTVVGWVVALVMAVRPRPPQWPPGYAQFQPPGFYGPQR